MIILGNFFITSQRKHILWVLIRASAEALLMITHNICFYIVKYEKSA